MKVIRARLYTKFDHDKEDFYREKLNLVSEEIKDFEIYYNAGEAELHDEDVLFFELETRALSFQECEKLLKLFRAEVKKHLGVTLKELLKMKLERLV